MLWLLESRALVRPTLFITKARTQLITASNGINPLNLTNGEHYATTSGNTTWSAASAVELSLIPQELIRIDPWLENLLILFGVLTPIKLSHSSNDSIIVRVKFFGGWIWFILIWLASLAFL